MKNIWKIVPCITCILPLAVAQTQSSSTQTTSSGSSSNAASSTTTSNGTTSATAPAAIPSPTAVRRSRHVYTNDDLAIYAHERQGNTVQATETPSANPANPAQAGTEASGTQTTSSADEIAAADAKKKQLADDYNKQAADLKKEIASLQREIDVDQREMKLRQAYYYGDAGTQLRDGQKFAEEAKKSQDDLQAKQQQLTDTQKKLEDLREQARRAGVKISE